MFKYYYYKEFVHYDYWARGTHWHWQEVHWQVPFKLVY